MQFELTRAQMDMVAVALGHCAGGGQIDTKTSFLLTERMADAFAKGEKIELSKTDIAMIAYALGFATGKNGDVPMAAALELMEKLQPDDRRSN